MSGEGMRAWRRVMTDLELSLVVFSFQRDPELLLTVVQLDEVELAIAHAVYRVFHDLWVLNIPGRISSEEVHLDNSHHPASDNPVSICVTSLRVRP